MKAILILLLSVFLMSCGSARKMGIGGEDKFIDNDKFFVSSFYGTAKDPNTAKHIALLNCRGDLATKIKGKIMAGIESYANQYQKSTEKKGMIRDESGKFESNITSFVETEIGDATVIHGRMSEPNRKGEYTYFVAMQVSKDISEKLAAQVEEVVSELPDNIKARINYDQEKFKEYLKQYMKK